MTNLPPFDTPEYQEYFRNEQEKHNASMEVTRQFHEKYLETLKKQLQVDLERFNNQELRKTIDNQIKSLNDFVEKTRKEIDDNHEKFKNSPRIYDAMNRILVHWIKAKIEVTQSLCKGMFNKTNHPIDYKLLTEIETIGNNLIAYAESKKWE